MSKNEDVLLQSYQYAWSKDSDLSLLDFLTKYKPSMVQNDGTKPWIWVEGSAPAPKDENIDAAIKEASILLKEVTDKVETIKNDESIPLRSNKKTGVKSKKEVREQAQAEATEKLKGIAIKHGYVSGKWLIFAPAERVDMIWTNLATSLVSGPLASTSAYLAKVATSPEGDSATFQHLICLYMPDIYDKDAVTEVMRILLRNHGVNLTGVKSDLYTSLGIDSKHSSGIPSTVWKNSAILKDSEIKELKEAFFTDLAAAKAKPPASIDVSDHAMVVPAAQSKAKPKLKKKADDDPFASDDDKEEEEEEKRKQEVKVKKAITKTKRPKESEDEDEDTERPKKKRDGRK